MPATAGGSTSGSSISVSTTARPRNRRRATRYAAGVPTRKMIACATRLVFAVTTSASRTTPLPSWPRSSPGRHAQEHGGDRQQEEREREAEREDERDVERRAARHFFAAGTPNPAAVRRARPVLPSTLVMKARASALFALAETTQMP